MSVARADKELEGQKKEPSPPRRRHARPSLTSAYQAPENGVQRVITGIWEQQLGIEGLGVRDSFFELGGNSLVGIEIMSRIREELKIELPLRHLFESGTIAGLSVAIETVQASLEKPGQIETSGREVGSL